MKMPWESAIKSITGLISEAIVDDDKQAEIALELERLQVDVRKTLLSTKTTVRVDAFVKVLIAFRDIVIPLLRPIGAGAMTVFAAYCTYKEIPLAGATETMLYSAFPAWGASRHVHKSRKIENQPSDSGWEDGFD